MAHHVPNRRGLNDAEITELDDIAAEYDAAREQARNALIAAQAAYQATIRNAADRRDDRVLGIIDAANGRGTQSRVVEHLGMNPSYLSIRLRKARARAESTRIAAALTTGYLAPALEAMGEDPNGYLYTFDISPNDESATPHQKDGASSSTHKPPTQRR